MSRQPKPAELLEAFKQYCIKQMAKHGYNHPPYLFTDQDITQFLAEETPAIDQLERLLKESK